MGTGPMSPKTCKSQIKTTTNTTTLRRLLMPAAIGIYVFTSHRANPTRINMTMMLMSVIFPPPSTAAYRPAAVVWFCTRPLLSKSSGHAPCAPFADKL